MMEAGANEVSEDVVLEAIERAQEVNLEIIELQEQLAELFGKPHMEYAPRSYDHDLTEKVCGETADDLAEAMTLEGDESDSRVAEIKAAVFDQYGEEHDPSMVATAFDEAFEAAFKRRVLDTGERPDGRGLKEIRPLSSEVGLFPRTHGTGLFTRGRDTGAGRVHARLGRRRSEDRQHEPGRREAVHASLQLPAFLDGRG